MNSHGLVNVAGEVLGTEAGEEGRGNIWQEGHQFDLKPKFDELRVMKVLLAQRGNVGFTEDLLEIRRQLCEVLQEEKDRNKKDEYLEIAVNQTFFVSHQHSRFDGDGRFYSRWKTTPRGASSVVRSTRPSVS